MFPQSSQHTARVGSRRDLSSTLLAVVEVAMDTQYTITLGSEDPDEESEESSGAEQWTDADQPKDRRRRETNVILPLEMEKDLCEWLQHEVPFIYDKRDSRHKQKELIDSCWNTKGASLNPNVSGENLKLWFNSQRSRYGRLIKDNNEDLEKVTTKRKMWIRDTFSFLKPHIRRQRTPRCMGLHRKVSINVSFIHVAVVHGRSTRSKIKVPYYICTFLLEKCLKRR